MSKPRPMFTKAELRLLRREVAGWPWPPPALNPRRDKIIALVAKIDALLSGAPQETTP